MATIDDLPIKDFASMSDDELLALIKDVRMARRTPPPEVRAATIKKAEAKRKRGKAIALQDVGKMATNLSPEQAKAFLEAINAGK